MAYDNTDLLFFAFNFFFGQEACGILVLRLGIKPGLLALEVSGKSQHRYIDSYSSVIQNSAVGLHELKSRCHQGHVSSWRPQGEWCVHHLGGHLHILATDSLSPSSGPAMAGLVFFTSHHSWHWPFWFPLLHLKRIIVIALDSHGCSKIILFCGQLIYNFSAIYNLLILPSHIM